MFQCEPYCKKKHSTCSKNYEKIRPIQKIKYINETFMYCNRGEVEKL